MSRRRKGLPLHGWIAIDKPGGLTSTQVVGKVRRATGAAKLGHGGTLDPAATGLLPIALGEATKTIAWCQEARKTYRFSLCWGRATTTDDAEGRTVACSDHRPGRRAIMDALPRFLGEIEQVPPAFSAVKVGGRRAFDLARRGHAPALEPRPVRIDSLRLLDLPDPAHARFELVCGKGTYVRSLARDLARALGTVGHVDALRRTQLGRFDEKTAISVAFLEEFGHGPPSSGILLPVETALDDVPVLAVMRSVATRLGHGRSVEVPEDSSGLYRARHGDRLVAIVRAEGGRARPVRVFNSN